MDKLILAVTLSRQNAVVQRAVGRWMELARQNRYRDLMMDAAEKSYSKAYLKKRRLFYPLLAKIGKPKDLTRFLIQASSCLCHDAYAELPHIACPVLVLGGGEDQIAGPDASAEIANNIPSSRLFIYAGLGHAAYEEAKDFHARVLHFLHTGL